MTAYHKWLVKQRIYCEHRGCRDKLSPAVAVVNQNGKDLVMCEQHKYQPRIQNGSKQTTK